MRNTLEVLFGKTFWLGVEVGDAKLCFASLFCCGVFKDLNLLCHGVLIDLFGNQLLGVLGLDEDVIVND
jgi:hypothetical protein